MSKGMLSALTDIVVLALTNTQSSGVKNSGTAYPSPSHPPLLQPSLCAIPSQEFLSLLQAGDEPISVGSRCGGAPTCCAASVLCPLAPLYIL